MDIPEEHIGFCKSMKSCRGGVVSRSLRGGGWGGVVGTSGSGKGGRENGRVPGVEWGGGVAVKGESWGDQQQVPEERFGEGDRQQVPEGRSGGGGGASRSLRSEVCVRWSPAGPGGGGGRHQQVPEERGRGGKELQAAP